MQVGRRAGYRLWLVVPVLVVFAAGCTGTARKAVYEGARAEKPLEVPPDLSLPRQADAGHGSATWSGYQRGAAGSGTGQPVPAPLPPGVRLERDGALRWLAIEAPPERVWEQARAFFQRLGFRIKRADRGLGVLETDWQENKAYVPDNWFARFMARFHGTGIMDRYRVRVEAADGGSLLFIAHRGLRRGPLEGDEEGEVEGWLPRDSDPELELEMLREFAAFLAGGQAARQVAEQAAAAEGPGRGRLEDSPRGPRLVLREGFDRAWRLLQIGLDRLGAEVVDRDRSAGRYLIVLPEGLRPRKGGWLSRLLGQEAAVDPGRLVLVVEGEAGRSEVRLEREDGGTPGPDLARTVLGELLKALR